MTKDHHSLRVSQSLTFYLVTSLSVLFASGVGFWWVISTHLSTSTLNKPAPTRLSSRDTPLLSKQSPQLTQNQEYLTEKLTAEQRVDQVWRALDDIDFARLLPLKPMLANSNRALGLLGGSLSRWKALAAREGFLAEDYGGRPALKNGPVRVTLRVREGLIIGAELDFDQEGSLAAGPEWSRAAMMLAGPTIFGGPHDPMMTLDALTAPCVTQGHKAQGLDAPQRNALSGVWPATSSRVSISYYLALSHEGIPLKARLWLTPREAP